MYIIFPKFHIKLFLFLLCVFFTFTQCKKDETSSTSDGIVIAKEVKVVSNETWNNQFISLDSSNYTITFSKDITSTQQIRSGDIIVSSAGEGLLRKVKSVSTTNNEIKVQTEPVSLTEVVQQGSIEFEKPLSMTQVSSIDYYYKGVKISSENIKGNTQTQFDWNINTVLYDDDSNPQTTNDQIKLVGKFSCDWKLKAKIIIGLKEGLKEVNFGFESGEDLNLQLIAGMQYKFEKEAKLATIRFTPITVFVGVVPVVFTPQLNIYAGIDGSAKASITTGINQSMSFNAGISYFKDQGWSPYKTFEKDINFQPPQINMNASAGIYLKPEILLKIYSIAGPYANLKLYGRIDANILETPWWKMYGGISMSAGAKVDILDKFLLECTISDLIKHEQLLAQATSLPATLPTVTTNNAISITSTGAISGGNVTSDGGASITARGICWNNNTNPTITLNTKTNEGNGLGTFTSHINDLTPNTLYYVRAYATNSIGTSYGPEVTFTTLAAINIPALVTSSASNINETSATVGGNITSDGGATIIERGIYYSTSSNPETSGTKLQIGSGTGSFSANLTGLTSGAKYYIKAYAKNTIGEALGNEVTFTTTGGTDSEQGTVTDFDGNIYKTIKIGNQIWMAENLKTTHYADGSPVNGTSTYGDVNTYGLLYTWDAIMNNASSSNSNPSGIQGIAPDGWHIPSDAEWKELEAYLGMSASEIEATGRMRGIDEGGKLKETGTGHWTSPNVGATDEYGFKALPAGFVNQAGSSGSLGISATFWCSTTDSQGLPYKRTIVNDNSQIQLESILKGKHYSIRCVKDNQ